MRSVPGRLVLGVAMAITTACGSGTTGSSGPTNSAPPASGSTSAPGTATADDLVVDPGAGWHERSLTIETAGIETQTPEPGAPRVSTAVDLGDRLVALGWLGGGFVIWESTDLERLAPVYSEVCCERNILWSPRLVTLGDRWVLAGMEEYPLSGDAPSPFVRVSDDEGRTWTDAADPTVLDGLSRIDDVVVSDGVVILQGVELADDGTPSASPWWSDDLATWHRVELADDGDGWVSFLAAGDEVWAFGAPIVAGTDDDVLWWRSGDGGRSFGAPITFARNAIQSFVPVLGRLALLPAGWNEVTIDTPAEPLRLVDLDGSVTEQPVDTGQWGDGWVTITPAHGTIDGRFYGLVGRQRLASVHYCYDDPDGCWQHEFVMVTTDDGVEWSDVVVPELDDMRLGSQTTLWTRPDGTILVTAADDSTGGVRLLEWTGASPPPTVDPAPYEPPDRSVPLVDPSASMSVGQVGRYPLGLGGCAGMYLDGRAWEPEVPLPDPPPPTWPVRDVQIADGPTAYVFGTVTKTADDTVEFSVADVGTVAVFHPRTAEPEYACG